MHAGMIRSALAAIAVVSCTSATEPLSSVSAVVLPETVVRTVESTSGRVDVSLKFLIDNPTPGPVYYSLCSASLERQAAELRWEGVASTTCLTYLSADPLDRTVMVPAGGSREVGAFLSGYGANGLPSAVPAGTYRVRFAILSRQPVIWQTMKNVQYRSWLLTTSSFVMAAD